MMMSTLAHQRSLDPRDEDCKEDGVPEIKRGRTESYGTVKSIFYSLGTL